LEFEDQDNSPKGKKEGEISDFIFWPSKGKIIPTYIELSAREQAPDNTNGKDKSK